MRYSNENHTADSGTLDQRLCEISGQSDMSFRNYGRNSIKVRKNRINIQTKLYIAALEGGSATKICGHVDDYVREAHAKFRENRRKGLGVTGR